MKFAGKTIVALNMLIQLTGAQRPISVRLACRPASRKYGEKIAALLLKAGLLQSRRGCQGGIYLALRPECISVLAVVRAIEEDIFRPEPEDREEIYRLKQLTSQALSQAWSLTLKDLAEGA